MKKNLTAALVILFYLSATAYPLKTRGGAKAAHRPTCKPLYFFYHLILGKICWNL